MAMDAELKAKWVKALRSGEYRQGTDYLRHGNGYCCLGVLCEISGEGSWIRDPGDPLDWCYHVDGISSAQYLPPAIRARRGPSDEACGTLMEMNDSGLPFPEIADYIEEHL